MLPEPAGDEANERTRSSRPKTLDELKRHDGEVRVFVWMSKCSDCPRQQAAELRSAARESCSSRSSVGEL